MNKSYQTNGPLLIGPVIPISNISDASRLAAFPSNRSPILALLSKFRVRNHKDGWFVDGSRHKSQIWEFGTATLGLTVSSRPLIRKCSAHKDWLTPTQIGDDETNFKCLWSDDNLLRLQKLVGLQRRKLPQNPV